MEHQGCYMQQQELRKLDQMIGRHTADVRGSVLVSG